MLKAGNDQHQQCVPAPLCLSAELIGEAQGMKPELSWLFPNLVGSPVSHHTGRMPALLFSYGPFPCTRTQPCSCPGVTVPSHLSKSSIWGHKISELVPMSHLHSREPGVLAKEMGAE